MVMRLENDSEYATRQAMEKDNLTEREARERAEFIRLSAKFS